jgi:hypothetical protein
LFWAAAASADTIDIATGTVAEKWGNFTGQLCFTAVSNTLGYFDVTLTNTTDPSKGGGHNGFCV